MDNPNFNEYFKEYYERCVLLAQSFVCDRSEAELIASDSLFVLWQKLSKGGSIDCVPAFLFGTVKNKALNYLRGRSREASAMGDASSVAERDLEMRLNAAEAYEPLWSVHNSDVDAIVRDTLEHLGAKTSSIFRMSRVGGLSYKEIAERTGISRKAVEYHIGKALGILRKKLEDFF